MGQAAAIVTVGRDGAGEAVGPCEELPRLAGLAVEISMKNRTSFSYYACVCCFHCESNGFFGESWCRIMYCYKSSERKIPKGYKTILLRFVELIEKQKLFLVDGNC